MTAAFDPLPFLAGQIRLLSPTRARIEGDDETVAALDPLLSYLAPGYRYDPRFKRGIWDGQERLLAADLTFPAGLAPEVGAAAGVEVVGWPDAGRLARLPAPLTLSKHSDIKLREYQQTAVEAALAAQRGLLVMPTASGKTFVIAELLRRLGRTALVIVPTKELLNQTAARLREYLGIEDVQQFGGGSHDFGFVTVATFQALYRARDLGIADELAAYEVVVADEAHHVSATTFSAVLEMCSGAAYRYGFTATPDTGKTTDMVVRGMTGPIIYEMSGEEGVARGVLTPPTVWIMRLQDEPRLEYFDTQEQKTLPLPGSQWHKIHKEGIVRNAPRNTRFATVAAAVAQEWGPTLVVVRETEHGGLLLDQPVWGDTRVAYVDGSQSTAVRASALARLGAGDLQCLIATGILDEGVDVPTLSAVVLADGGRADYKVIQRIGRGRRIGGREQLLVLDSHDRAHPILTYHARKRQALYAREGWPVEWLAPI